MVDVVLYLHINTAAPQHLVNKAFTGKHCMFERVRARKN
jgi:hypothetical protein